MRPPDPTPAGGPEPARDPEDDASATSITQLLNRAATGDEEAWHALVPLVYEELRGLAARQMARERAGHTLAATALVHEFLGPLSCRKNLSWENRRAFYGMAQDAMRKILCSHARERLAEKRQWDRRIDSPTTVLGSLGQVDDEKLLELADLIDFLAEKDPRAAEAVGYRVFLDLSIPEIADCMGISTRTVDRLLAKARGWLERVFD